MRLSINDPLPAGIGGPDAAISPLRESNGEAHSVAPVHSVPRSGASPFLFLGMAGVIMACAVSLRILRTLRAERDILALMSDSPQS